MSGIYEKFIRPLMFGLDAETAHEIGIESLRLGLATDAAQAAARRRYATDALGPVERFGLTFANPLGMAAGFDKNGIVVNQLAALGFGFVEVGTVTYKPQKGNAKPRLFRLPEDHALINRLGFNNDGARVVAERLKTRERNCVLGVNIGKNKDVPNEEAIESYLACFDLVYDVADYIAVNVSSPNTPGLRDLQRGENLGELIAALMERNDARRSKPLLIKIAPDLSESEIKDIVDICLAHRVAGVIATNTTITRESLRTRDVAALGAGGLSGKPLSERSTEVIRTVYEYAKGELPVIGVGGIFTAEDAFEKIAAGASLVQAYTGFIYAGPSFARDINAGLKRILHERGFARLDDVIGCDLSP